MCAVISMNVFTCVVVSFVTCTPHMSAWGQLHDASDLQASTEGWCSQWGTVPGPAGRVRHYLCVFVLVTLRVRGLITYALQLKRLRSSGLSVYFLLTLYNKVHVFSPLEKVLRSLSYTTVAFSHTVHKKRFPTPDAHNALIFVVLI